MKVFMIHGMRKLLRMRLMRIRLGLAILFLVWRMASKQPFLGFYLEEFALRAFKLERFCSGELSGYKILIVKKILRKSSSEYM